MNDDLVGLQEIADIAGVPSSAVSNWRRRFDDFPEPLAELKSGPVFSRAVIDGWLARRDQADLALATRFYDQLAASRGDDATLAAKIDETVALLIAHKTSESRPGILLGKVQSGKTRAFLGIIARSFDSGYGVAVILTKGTRSLAQQTLSRVRDDYSAFIISDQMQVHDIMNLPSLTPYELEQKLVLVVKKEDDNLRRLLKAFTVTYPQLCEKKVLLVDDEADLASVSFQKRGGVAQPGKVSSQIDELCEVVNDLDYLQVTATPYALYLQPENELSLDSGKVFKPKRPQFTVLLPTHASYVGGDCYFDQSTDPTSPAYHFYQEVPVEERDALKHEDRRRLKIENVLYEPRARVLRDALMAFLAGASIRRLQERSTTSGNKKYSFLFHTEQAKKSHEWQERIVTAIHDALVSEARDNTPQFNELLTNAVSDLARSVGLAGTSMPDFDELKREVVAALVNGQMMITKVNSDKDIEQLLDDNGQLKLRTPFNIFIGGQILDRGVTIGNLIGFYYGRNPKSFQQDTVLQHSRMYGVRPLSDLAVTRFYAPLHVYQVMKKIHEFDAALREAFESGAHDRGVYFIQKDANNRLTPCSPNKLLLSNVSSIRPGRRMLPIGFQTVSKTQGAQTLTALDDLMSKHLGEQKKGTAVLDVSVAVNILELAYQNLEFSDGYEDDRRAHVAALEHLSKTSASDAQRGKVRLIGVTDRNIKRYREEGRFSDAPDTSGTKDVSRGDDDSMQDMPTLVLLRQEGAVDKGWRDLPFWWPVIVTPKNAVTSIFTTDPAPSLSADAHFEPMDIAP